MRILVQKFGGSSVAKAELRQQVVSKIIAAKKQGYSLVVVVSAIGRKGDPYATDTLLSLAEKDNLELNSREKDLLMSCGEIISGVVLTGTIQKAGCKSICLSGYQAGIQTDNNYGDARILTINNERIMQLLKEDYIVVVTGFQGATHEGEITTLGRGGSDTTASALGVTLDAEAIEIYTDVDGVKTADPRIVSDAKTLDKVTYEEVCQLAYEGAKVIHPRAVEIAAQKSIPLKIKCTFTDDEGTLVINGEYQTIEQSCRNLNDKIITGITHISNIAQIKVPINSEDEAKASARVFKSLAEAGISIDFINAGVKELIFTVKEDLVDKACKILNSLSFEPQVKLGCAKVAVVGAGMTGKPGVMASVVDALAEENISILQSADSHTTIWCLVDQEVMEKAICALHRKFCL
ncbi:aspartate kinase [Bacillota bacterium LX-D]|nr:aspartate kinase [Bacillota bacterium LX-D]